LSKWPKLALELEQATIAEPPSFIIIKPSGNTRRSGMEA
jgi:hypothetical protein